MSLRRFDLTSGPDVRWSLRLLEAPRKLAEAAGVAGREVPAEVPGCAHTDLMRAGMLQDPYIGTDELNARWIGECSWRYSAHFQFEEAPALRSNAATSAAPEHPVAASLHDAGPTRLDLVFDGIDTLATVRLNGHELGVADNMHATWRFDVRKTLRRGGNILEIDFPAPLPFCRQEIRRYSKQIGDFPAGGAGANPQLPQHMLRKMHCNFGWDWGPQLVTCGIWRDVRLEAWETARISALRPRVVAADARQAEVEVAVDVEWSSTSEEPLTLYLELFDPAGEVAVRSPAIPAGQRATLLIEDPELWWPSGHGEQPLYTLVASIHGKDGGALLDRVQRKIGLRTFEWVTTPDGSPAAVVGQTMPLGATFHLRVNGRRVFCKGANWIPDDCFPSRVTPDRYRRRVEQARDANMNMLRVWGGGIYESDAFYDACDELGVMVWQDFATACSAYPEDDAFKGRLEHEARDNVARLAGRASLALWCGGNECIQAVHDWGNEYRRLRKAKYGWGKHYWYDLFPRIVAELDPGTFYWPNSPWSEGTEARRHEGPKGSERGGNAGGAVSTPLPRAGEVPSASASEAERADELPPNLQHIGDQHIWDVWNGQGDWRNYWSHAPRFASEFGFHGPPTWPTLAAAIPESERHWLSPSAVLHNKQDGGQQRAIDRARDHFRLPPRPESPESFEAMWFVAALNQARAIQAGCEWFRALSPWCGGALYWQLNDCWPVASWSAIDNDSAGLGRPKLLWYATRRFFAPRMCALLPATPLQAASLRDAGGGDPAASAALPASPRDAATGATHLPRVYLHNDHPEPWRGDLRLRLVHFDGQTLEEVSAPFEIEPGGSLRFMVPGDWPPAADRLIVAEAQGANRVTWFFGRDKDLPYPPPDFEVCARLEGSSTRVKIAARTLLRDLCIFADRIDPAAQVSDQLITLLPGETADIRIDGPRLFSPSELLVPGIIWSANQFGLID